MATKSISQLDTQATATETDLFEVAIVDANSASGYASKKESAAAIADAIVGEYQYPLRITGTTAKTIAGAINELKNLVDLLPQFAIEVVQTLPVSDISETTIYLVPASDPEQGNYYEEYIYVNNAWELVGTTAVDLSGYYTSAQVDTLLAAKANTASLATVATSGAYSDLSGKPTIDTALDTTSTNAVENRAVASEINSIKSDISVDGSASGDIATFVDGSDNPLKELKISIVATQSGSGDPSPTNVRPIIGFSAVDVIRCGKNLINVGETRTQTVGGLTITVNNDGSVHVQGTASFGVGFSLVGENGGEPLFYLKNGYKYTIQGTNIQINGTTAKAGMTSPVTFTANDGDYVSYAWLYFSQGATVNATYYPRLELGSAATAYEPYNGETINIDWQSTAGTVYGGELNVKTGVLTVTHKLVKVSDINWLTYDSANHIFYIYGLDKANGENNIMSNIYANKPIYQNDFSILGYATTSTIFVRDSRYNTPTEFKNSGENTDIVYELATPVTYQLTPTEIRSLLGVNNVWADCGSVTELKYTRDLNLCINDIIARIEALEGGSSNRSLSLSPVLTKSLTSELDTTEGKTEETEEETKEEAQNER